MQIRDLYFENDEAHFQAMQDTGYWGKQGAGCIFFSQDTRRFCIFHRSELVLEPGTWGGVGGAIDANENPEQAVKREVQEEARYTGSLKLQKFYVFQDKSFRYTNFVGIIPKEFNPHLNWENQGWRWVEFGDWPKPLHPGIAKAFADPGAQKVLQRLCK